MKKKVLLIFSIFLFITNVKALTFNVDVTNIEDKGNNGTIGSITNIDLENKTLNTLFKQIGAEVSFDLTVTNSGDRAGTLRSISITSSNDKVEYTHSLPEGGLSINGNDFNTVTITAKVLQGAVSGTSTSTIKITYNYDEGSCPEGEILSDDESMCSCPEGKVRNEFGICVEPETKVTCEDDEIYNETKKICERKINCESGEVYNETTKVCEKKETPVIEKEDLPKDEKVVEKPVEKTITVSNPKTIDNIVLIALLFIVSGLGIYAVLFKKLKTNKQKVTTGVIIGVLTLGTSFTVLASVFGIDNLLGAIINPITKNTELIVTVNEEIDLIETWDGTCSQTDLTPENIFEGGSGTEDDPYQIKTADQLACFANSVTKGKSYNGKFIEQISDIILNDNLNENIAAGNTEGLHIWLSAGNSNAVSPRWFAGTYNGNNYVISGLYITDESSRGRKGLFSYTSNATLKNMILSDVYMNTTTAGSGALIGYALKTLTLDNITVSGTNETYVETSGGIIGTFYGASNGLYTSIRISNTTNNISNVDGGIISRINGIGTGNEHNVVFQNVVNNGDFRNLGGIASVIGSADVSDRPYILFDNVVNNGNRSGSNNAGVSFGGLVGYISAKNISIQNSGNTGNIQGNSGNGGAGGLFGSLNLMYEGLINNCYNSGDITFSFNESYLSGLTADEITDLRRAEPTGIIGGIVGTTATYPQGKIIITNSYNTGKLSGLATIGGIIAYASDRDDNIYENLTIDNCYNLGEIRVGDGRVGGIVATTKGIIQNSYNKGDITIWGFRDPYGQLSDGNYHTGTVAGGIVGSNNNLTWDKTYTGATIIDSYNEGNLLVTAKTDQVTFGGICGFCTSITGSHNSGNITSKYASQYFEGIAFRTFGEVADTYFDGEIITENLSY